MGLRQDAGMRRLCGFFLGGRLFDCGLAQQLTGVVSAGVVARGAEGELLGARSFFGAGFSCLGQGGGGLPTHPLTVPCTHPLPLAPALHALHTQ